MSLIISYIDSRNSKYKEFIEYHCKFQTYVEVCVNKGYPKNYSKIAALKKVAALLEDGFQGLLVFCDIDTRITKLPTLDKVHDYDLMIYCRKFYPANLSVLSGFLIFNVNPLSRKKILNLIEKWEEIYHSVHLDWYSDQKSLAAAIMHAVVYEDLRLCDLNSWKGRSKYFWSTIPWPLSSAFTHKGKDFYLSYRMPKRLSKLAKFLDLFLILPNSMNKLLKKFKWYTIS